jgi:hypothetical protein
MKPSRWSIAVGLAWSIAIFGVVNYLSFARRPACFDCGFPRGVPFILFYDATFNGGGEVVWTGLLANILFALVSGLALAWLIHIASRRFGSQRTL